MQLYFGKVDLEQFKDIDPNDLYNNNGNYYWYKAIIDEEQICFFDTCGRHFPIGFDHVGETDTVLFAATKIHKAQEQTRKTMKKVRKEVEELLKFWENDE